MAGNRFDDFRPDLAALFEEQERALAGAPGGGTSAAGLNPLWGLWARVRLYATGFLVKTGLHARLVHANLRLDWFEEFREYWTDALGNRSIDPHEFHFLRGIYRQRIAEPIADVETLPQRQGWFDARSVHQLFHHQYRLALHPLQARRLVPYIPRGAHVCEYGAGLAPVITSLLRYYRHLDLRMTCADIPHLLFHFTRWRFRALPFVRTLVIEPGGKPPLDETYDTLICLQAFKYIPNPVAVMQHLEGCIRPGGYFVLDYFRPDEEGPDVERRLRERQEALGYLAERFRVVEGALPLDGAQMGRTVLRKLP
jgi:hypothetical protein